MTAGGHRIGGFARSLPGTPGRWQQALNSIGKRRGTRRSSCRCFLLARSLASRRRTTGARFKRTRKRTEGIRARWRNNGLIIDYMEAMEFAAGQAWKEASAVGGSPESDSFHDGVRVALVEFLRNRQPPQSLDGSSPFGRGRKQAWAILSAMMLGVRIGLDPPPVVLPELSEQDRQFAPGWIAPFGTTASREGIFDACDTFRFRWRETSKSPWDDSGPPTGSQPIPWSDVNWVRLMPLSSLLPGFAEEYPQIRAGSTDLNVIYGTLTGPGRSGAQVFGLVGNPANSEDQWLEIFRSAGVKIKARTLT